jgi:glyoxylase-like metal-dependent hydrolase (beta-lactamase superfamily II)
MSSAISTKGVKRVFTGGGPINAVSIASTGTGEGHWEHVYGSWKPAQWWIFFGRRWVTMPLNFFVIEHANGLVLFDAGQDRAVVTDPNYWPPGFTATVMRNLFKFHIGPDDTLPKQLDLIGYSLPDIDRVVCSHLHADHVGRVQELLHADLFVSEVEWNHMMQPHSERHMIFRERIAVPGANWTQISFNPMNEPAILPFARGYDLMGDGTMILLPTPGHTPGSISLLVRPDQGPPLLLAGDLSYRPELLENDRLPGTGDRRGLLDSFSKVRALKAGNPDLVILFSHDDRAAERLGEIR